MTLGTILIFDRFMCYWGSLGASLGALGHSWCGVGPLGAVPWGLGAILGGLLGHLEARLGPFLSQDIFDCQRRKSRQPCLENVVHGPFTFRLTLPNRDQEVAPSPGRWRPEYILAHLMFG